MSKFKYIIILEIACGIASVTYMCTSRPSATAPLDIVSAIIDEQPDSALSILLAMDIDSIDGKRDRARFNLYLTEALIRERYYIDDDSLIRTALGYYAVQG